jgi:CBS domain-containing protein
VADDTSSNDNNSSSNNTFRGKLGMYVVIGSSAGVILLGIVVMIAAAFAGKESVKESAQLLFTSILPLLGTWVGTVLAFYFTKESLEAGSKATMDTVRSLSQRLSSTPVSSTMMDAAKIIKVAIPAGQTVGDLTGKLINDEFEKTAQGQRISRLLIVNDTGACVGILHRSIWMEMQLAALQHNPAVATADPVKPLLLLTSQAGKTFNAVITGTLAYIAFDRTLADAKAAMSALPLCQDVIVTQTGNSTEPMRGWVSNVDIAKASQA